MKRFLVLLVATGLFAGMLVGTALSDGPPPHSPEGPPPHGHLLVTGVQVDEDDYPLSWRKCRPLANGEPVPTHAHHDNLHTGRAGEAQWNAGNVVVPAMAGFTPWSNCEELHEYFFGQ